jgi:V-type H+-transporting ATPase subunit C
LVQEKQRQYAPLVRWLKINFGEIFSAYLHVKALRVFVESVLRFGLPVNFQAAVMEPHKSAQKKLRSELNKLYGHLDGSAAGPIDVSSFCVHIHFDQFADFRPLTTRLLWSP